MTKHWLMSIVNDPYFTKLNISSYRHYKFIFRLGQNDTWQDQFFVKMFNTTQGAGPCHPSSCDLNGMGQSPSCDLNDLMNDLMTVNYAIHLHEIWMKYFA